MVFVLVACSAPFTIKLNRNLGNLSAIDCLPFAIPAILPPPFYTPSSYMLYSIHNLKYPSGTVPDGLSFEHTINKIEPHRRTTIFYKANRLVSLDLVGKIMIGNSQSCITSVKGMSRVNLRTKSALRPYFSGDAPLWPE
jgi:hypothetical protein